MITQKSPNPFNSLNLTFGPNLCWRQKEQTTTKKKNKKIKKHNKQTNNSLSFSLFPSFLLTSYAHQTVNALQLHFPIYPFSFLPILMEPPPKPKYVMLSDNHQASLRPPPYRRNVPRYHSKAHGGGGGGGVGCCLKCICCCYCFLFFLIFALFGLGYFLYYYYNPQIPSYKVSNFSVHAFNVKSDFSLYTEFIVIVKADNPNENIDFIYGRDSYVSVMYSESELCAGKIPNFRQPAKNVTDISILLSGNSEFGSGLQEALMQNRHSGRIPLLVEVKVPVTVVIGSLSLKKVNVFVNCSLVVDNLSPNKKVGILSSNYTYAASLWILNLSP